MEAEEAIAVSLGISERCWLLKAPLTPSHERLRLAAGVTGLQALGFVLVENRWSAKEFQTIE